jgi:hypothetical protein
VKEYVDKLTLEPLTVVVEKRAESPDLHTWVQSFNVAEIEMPEPKREVAPPHQKKQRIVTPSITVEPRRRHPNACDECEQSFSSAQLLRNHKRSWHS